MKFSNKKNSRIQNSIRNFTFGFGAYVFQYLLSFITRTIFINLLNAEYLGVNGLFSNILSVLSLAELGIEGAFSSLLYKPLHEGDTERIKTLMAAFKKAFIIIASIVGIAGLGVIPLLNVFIKDTNIEDIELIYIMFLMGLVISYLCTYRISLIIADQKSFISSLYSQIVVFIQYILQIVILLLTRNFIPYLAVQITGSISINLLLYFKAGKMYPYIKEKTYKKLDEITRRDLIKKIYASMYHHTGYVVLTGTDNIIISTFVGVYSLGIYSNYVLLIGVIIAFTNLFFGAIVASVGNLTTSTDNEIGYIIFRRIQFINFFIVALFSGCLYALLNPFIGLWIGENYLLSDFTVFTIVSSYYFGYNGIKKCVSIFKQTTGLFYYDRYSPVVEAMLNIVLSLVLVRFLAIAGVLLGTIISSLATNIWIEPYVVYKRFFKKPLKYYFRRFLAYGAVTLITGLLLKKIVIIINFTTWLGFFVTGLICVLITVAIFILLFHHTDEFKYFCNLTKRLLLKA